MERPLYLASVTGPAGALAVLLVSVLGACAVGELQDSGTPPFGSGGSASGGATGTGGSNGGSDGDGSTSGATGSETGGTTGGVGGTTLGDTSASGTVTGGGTTTSGTAGDTGGSGGSDDCSDELATGLSLRDAAVYQVIRIPVLSAGAEVAPGSRTADIVANRELVVRIDVDVDSGWSSRTVAARVSLGGATGSTFFDKLEVTGSSDRSDPSTSFLVEIPPDQVSEDATYSIALVECDADPPAATPGVARFPEQGEAALGARAMGPIKIHIVPFSVAGFVPETTPAILDGFAQAIRAMYPVTEVILTVGNVFNDGGTVDMGAHLVRLGELRDAEKPPKDVYYFGLISGAASRENFCEECPTGTSEAGGITSVGFAVGAAFGDELSESTLVHELGHMHGRKHAPCGTTSLLDDEFPYPNADITVEGYDYRTESFIPATRKDVMGTCQPRWVSDYTYRAFIQWGDLWHG